DDPPFATLFTANGDNATSNTTIKAKITVDTSLLPAGFGLSLEQPAWDPISQRFYVSVPQINYPAGCVPFDAANPCQGGPWSSIRGASAPERQITGHSTPR